MVLNQSQQQNMVAKNDVIIHARDVSVTFDMERGQSKVVNDVSLDLRRGETLGIVGESGSGKSMLASSFLNAVVNPGNASGQITYYPPDESEPIDVLELSEKELKNFRWERVSMVFQGALNSFNPPMKIRTHFTETLNAHGVNREKGMDRAYQLLSDLYLDPERVLDAYPHELSGGMKQRALIALSLLLEPEVLVLDEPTAALDLLMQRSILSLLEDIKEKYELTMVFITHDLPLLAQLADRLAVMYAFELAEIGLTKDMVRNPAHPYTRALLNAIPHLHAPLEEMRPIEGSTPDPVSAPDGCKYHPRCPLADKQCKSSNPPLQDIEDEHQAACFYWNKAADAIPMNLGDQNE